MQKKVTMAPKPQAGSTKLITADEWVSASQEIPRAAAASEPVSDPVAMKRLTIDIPEPLHMLIKSQCALKGVKMADAIRILLEQHFSPADVQE